LHIPRFVKAGEYTIGINMQDSAGNYAYLDSAELSERGFPSTIQVTSVEDLTPPELVSLIVSPTEVDTTLEPVTVRVQVEVKDDLSGFDSGFIYLSIHHAATFENYQSLYLGPESQTGGSKVQPLFEGNLAIPQFVRSGEYKIELSFVDSAENYVYLGYAELEASGFPSKMQVVSIEDVKPPELVSLALSPSEVDTTDGPAEVQVMIEVQDDISGFASMSIELHIYHAASGEGYKVLSLGMGNQTGGTELKPLLEGSLIISQFARAGTYRVELAIADSAGNYAYISSVELARRGFTDTIQVTSPVEDVTRPELVAFNVTPTDVDTTQGPASVQVEVELRDDLSGFELGHVYIWIDHSVTGEDHQELQLSGKDDQTGGTVLEPILGGVLLFPETARSGEYTIYMAVVDSAGNTVNIYSEELASRGFPGRLTVI